MIRMLLPVLLAIAGTGAGVGAGMMLAPIPNGETTQAAPDTTAAAAGGRHRGPARPRDRSA
jgi:hypothetical protein